MGRPRIWLVYTTIAVITGGSLFAIIKDAEYWPFSPYGMYSDMRRERSLTWLRLFGVTKAEEPQEIPLLAPEYIQPFDQSRLPKALSQMRRNPDKLREALRDCLMRYESLRLAGRHQGPPLQGIRLYRLEWQLDPWARNADRPDRRTLILEVMQPEKGGP